MDVDDYRKGGIVQRIVLIKREALPQDTKPRNTSSYCSGFVIRNKGDNNKKRFTEDRFIYKKIQSHMKSNTRKFKYFYKFIIL